MSVILPWTRANIRFAAKILIPVVAVIVLFIAATLWLVNGRIQNQLRNTGKSVLVATDKLFTKTFQARADNLVQQFSQVPNQAIYYQMAHKLNKSFNPADLQAGRTTILDTFGDFLQGPGRDLAFILFAGDRGQLLAATNHGDVHVNAEQYYSVCAPMIKDLLDSQKAGARLLQFDNRLFIVVTAPSIDEAGSVVGAMSFGVPLGETVAKQMKFPDSQLAFIANGEIMASTLPASQLGSELMKTYQQLQSAPAGIVQIDREHFIGLTSFLPVQSAGPAVGYMLLLSYEKSEQEFLVAQHLLIAVSIIGVILCTMAVWFVVLRITEPLRQLRDSAEAVSHGDFTRKIEIHSKDELGELAAVFNNMTENLQKSRIQLEKTVETLRTTQAQLLQSEKLSAVGEFVAGVAHELNNPLTALIGFSELLQTDEADEETRSCLKRISISAERCHKIVHSLLSFARQHPPERKVTNLNTVLEAVVEILLYELRTSNIKLIKELEPNLPRLLVDPHQLQQVFLNIVNNARQAIEAYRPHGSIRITTLVVENHVQVRIQDDGPGISEENVAKIFNPFFTTKPVGKGTGLGLSLTYGIIHEHGGAIKVESKVGQGTTFIIELPVAAELLAEPEQNGHRPKGLTNNGGGRQVLLVDDEEDILDLLRLTLEECGYKAQTAHDGEKALRFVNQQRFDLIICDWKMPGLNGQQLYESLLRHHPEAAQRLIFMTGDMLSETTERYLREHDKTCLAKPFSLTEFQATVSKMFQN